MAILPVYSCFHPILKKKTKPVSEIDGNLKKIIDDMYETMYRADGVGLAANQVGLDISVITIDISDKEEGKIYAPLTLINPVIEDFSEEKIEFKEGCLSIPELREWVSRPKQIQLKYFDIDAKEITVEYDEFFARVVQH
ncbi:MAG: peptide deformylase, partial [Candidatus Staskawiczbacteria bacterium]